MKRIPEVHSYPTTKLENTMISTLGVSLLSVIALPILGALIHDPKARMHRRVDAPIYRDREKPFWSSAQSEAENTEASI